ncbi:Phosphoenolpyruvate-protein phosphotransferase of PTS system [Thermogutta terrifontis]|uniref:Phosphoenolpyruvate-protein phosphotransferase n=2 Tax=Thermogutta terrifontis TaxID=1331910 RepID=A0A286RLW9_9BACT|nr:Phosphoenolpyruvate-protein phosphotransferase of PTS system [Thermogutta terrifontis]
MRLQGIAVSPGIAIGKAVVIGQDSFSIPREYVEADAVEQEVARFREALQVAAREIENNRDLVTRELGPKSGAIFQAHLEILEDPKIREDVESLIRNRQYSSEKAVSLVLRQFAEMFRRLPNPVIADRAYDVLDIERHLLRALLGQPHRSLYHLTSPAVVLARNLTPSEVANLDRKMVRGFATELGGPTSHTAIVAQGMGIPAVVGTGPFLTEVSGGDIVIVDGDRGIVIVRPDESTLREYEEEARAIRAFITELEKLRDLPAETLDGTRIEIYGNIEFPHEAALCLQNGAEGIGLYRTEFLYLGRNDLPSEEDHYQAYCEVVRIMGDRPVTIRTFDLGADKVPLQLGLEKEANPCLGLRSIRLALRYLPLFQTQLRAILRASVCGNVQIMFPMISTLAELRQAKLMLAEVMEDLAESRIPFRRDIPLGIMVEVPSVAVTIDRFLDEVDFISLGTNDLIQYTLAVDRTNRNVVNMYNATEPAVLRLIHHVIQEASRKGVPVSLCGQMSSHPLHTMLLIGLGLRKFSVAAHSILEIKKVCRSVTVQQCEALAKRALEMDHARDVQALLREQLIKLIPAFSRIM